MSYSKKGISVTIATLIVAAVVIVAAGGILIWQRQAAPEDTEPYVKVISPNGGEDWQVGQDYTIKWENGNLPASAHIFIRMKRNDGGIVRIMDEMRSRSGQSKYAWEISTADLSCWSWGASCVDLKPEEIFDNKLFKIEIVAYWPNPDDNRFNMVTMDGSDDYFSIGR